MYKYEMDPTRTVGATERTRDAGRTDGQTDRWSETSTPKQLHCAGGLIEQFQNRDAWAAKSFEIGMSDFIPPTNC